MSSWRLHGYHVNVVSCLAVLSCVTTFASVLPEATHTAPDIRVELRGGGIEWHGSKEFVTGVYKGRVGVSPGSVPSIAVQLPEYLSVPTITELDEVRIQYPESASRRTTVYPMAFLVLEHSEGVLTSSVYAVPAIVTRDQQRRVVSVLTPLLGRTALASTIRQAATLAGLRGRLGRVYGGVAMTVEDGTERFYVAELRTTSAARYFSKVDG